MNYLNRMYNNNQTQSTKNTKNPNRVASGLRSQGADHFELLGEDGSINQVPTQKYVQSLEQQIKKQRTDLSLLEGKLRKQQSSVDQLRSIIANQLRS